MNKEELNYKLNMIFEELMIIKGKLEEENKVLKELNVCVGCEDNPTYKARIDKAIEYLDDLQNNIFDGERGNKVRKIIGILKGSDKE